MGAWSVGSAFGGVICLATRSWVCLYCCRSNGSVQRFRWKAEHVPSLTPSDDGESHSDEWRIACLTSQLSHRECFPLLHSSQLLPLTSTPSRTTLGSL